MTTRLGHSQTRVALAVALLLVGLLATPQAARADWIIRGDTIPADQVVDNDVIITGTDVRVDGTVNGDVVAVGSTVTVNGTVNGSLVAVARTVSVGGEVGGSVYAVGRTLRLGSSSYVQNNVHFAGILLDSQQGSKIGRDLVAASVRATIGSEIGRGLNAIIALMSFKGKIGYGLDQSGEGIAPAGAQVPPQPVADGSGNTLLFVGLGAQKIAGYAAPARGALYTVLAQDEEGQGLPLPEWLLARMGEFVTLLLVGGLLAWLFPSLLGRWTGRLRARPLPAVGYGVLALIISANGIGIAIVLAAMLVAVGIWLGQITLWTLAFLFWGVGFSLLVLAGSLLALAVFFLSKVIVSYLAALMILERLAPRAARYRLLVLLLGLVLYILLRSIPTIGWVIEMVVVVLGLGAIWLAFLKREHPAPQAASEAVESA